MRFKRYDTVRYPVHNSFWTGMVLGYVQKLEGQFLCIVQKDAETVFVVGDDNKLEAITLHVCKHDTGFTFQQGAWHCNQGCGASYMFDPEAFLSSIALLPEQNKRNVKTNELSLEKRLGLYKGT